MVGEPPSGVPDDCFEGTPFFEQVRSARYDDQFFFTAQLPERGAIKSQHLKITDADS